IWLHFAAHQRTITFATCITIFAIGAWALIHFTDRAWYQSFGQLVGHIFAATCALTGTLATLALAPLYSSRWLADLGRRSLIVYLVHSQIYHVLDAVATHFHINP